LLSVPVQVIAWRTVSEMTYNVSSGTLNLTHSLTLTVSSTCKTDLTVICIARKRLKCCHETRFESPHVFRLQLEAQKIFG